MACSLYIWVRIALEIRISSIISSMHNLLARVIVILRVTPTHSLTLFYILHYTLNPTIFYASPSPTNQRFP